MHYTLLEHSLWTLKFIGRILSLLDHSIKKNVQLKFLIDNCDDTIKRLTFLFMSLMRFGGIRVVDLHIFRLLIWLLSIMILPMDNR